MLLDCRLIVWGSGLRREMVRLSGIEVPNAKRGREFISWALKEERSNAVTVSGVRDGSEVVGSIVLRSGTDLADWMVLDGSAIKSGMYTLAPWHGQVVRVIDGDTVDVDRDGDVVRVRLAAVDAPERGQPYGSEAAEFLNELLKYGIMVKPVDSSYGRTVAWLVAGDVSIGVEVPVQTLMLYMGTAWCDPRYCDDEALWDAEKDARVHRRGLWADDDPVPPWLWRKNQRKEIGE